VAQVTTHFAAEYSRHVYHVYAIQVADRDALLAFLGEQGIACGIHYPVPVHLQEAYQSLGHRVGDFPRAEQAAATTLSLPMFPELSTEQIEYLCEKIGDFFN